MDKRIIFYSHKQDIACTHECKFHFGLVQTCNQIQSEFAKSGQIRPQLEYPYFYTLLAHYNIIEHFSGVPDIFCLFFHNCNSQSALTTFFQSSSVEQGQGLRCPLEQLRLGPLGLLYCSHKLPSLLNNSDLLQL